MPCTPGLRPGFASVPPASLLVASIVLLTACAPELELGQRCERTSECASPFSCVLGRCRSECVDQRDCPLGAECVGDEGMGVCTLPAESCASDEECPEPLICAGLVCRAVCVEDDDCRPGARCEPVSARNVCVREDTTGDAGVDGGALGGVDGGVDAGQDAAVDAGAPRCSEATSGAITPELSGWCFDQSGGLDLAARARVIAEVGGHALELDLRGAPAGSWIRAYQEVPLVESEQLIVYVPTLETTRGAGVFALEALDASGAVVGRFAYTVASPEVPDPCDATGHETDACDVVAIPSTDFAFSTGERLGQIGVDLSRVARVRRTIEIVAGPESQARLITRGAAVNPARCSILWSRSESALFRELFDRPQTGLGTSLAWAGDLGAPVRAGDVALCGSSLRLEGRRWLERAAGLPGEGGAITVELTMGARGSYGGVEPYAILWQDDGDLALTIEERRLRASAGRCPGSGEPALEVIDGTRLILDAEPHVEEISIALDPAGPRLCLARNGVVLGCDETPACALPARGAGALRIGAGASGVHRPFDGIVDELHVRPGDVGPDPARSRSGRCYLDRVCAGMPGARDTGSHECVPVSACTSLAACPAHARDANDHCAETALRTTDCFWRSECYTMTASCTGGCFAEGWCREDIALTEAECP